ncbi:uncharacterized protein LOC119368671 [Triticum dicoccoides]|uniref:uncharacterized protein LOC119368671 n=1 Tax=Triticum dicoccoides TaxID=85692 RepID=UPI0018908A7A|nr:uncharacterized protein LOC119368671 [Triticum dicoccoides]
MASLLSSSVLLPVGHPTSRCSAGGRLLSTKVGWGLLSFAAPEDTKVCGLLPVPATSRGSAHVVLAVPEGFLSFEAPEDTKVVWGLLPANTTKATRGNGIVALAVPEGASGGWGLLPANATKTSRGVLALAVPEGASGGWGLLPANATKTSRGVLALAVPEGASGGWGLLPANATKTSRGVLALAVPPGNATKTTRGNGVVAFAWPEEGANRWSGWGPLPEGAPAEDVKAFYAQDFINRVDKIGTINSYALFGHADILEVAAEAAERCIQVVHLLQPVLVDEFASRPRAKTVVGVTTTLSVRLVEHCRIVLSECEEGYVREHPLREALYGLNALNRTGYPKPALVTASRTEAEKVAYFKHLADEFKELALEVEASVNEWNDSGKSAGWFDQPVKMRSDD